MTITTFAVGAAVTPTVIKTYISHYANRRPRRQKPTAHISYDEGLHLIRTFLKYASHNTVEDLQAFTSQWVPSPSWVRTENVPISEDYTSKAAKAIIDQLGPAGVELVGGTNWWQWRPKGADLKAEWIEMRTHYNEHKRKGAKSRRIMLYVHGGGYFFGSVDEHRYQMQRHARKLKARVFAPRYRLAPQFPFPCGLQDCLAAYFYLLSIHDPTEIIFAGDSAGGGMIVSMLCTLRDRGLPLPAGAILISPWVDLTHSFPSLNGESEMDYIPPHGFMQKPSASWPPPNDKEVSIISDLAKGKDVGSKLDSNATIPVKGDGEVKPASQLYLSVDLGGARVIIKDQIQMYTTNQLLCHPMVSPVMQPSLGGLPPILILTGGGEILRDEQIYLAHKMANPSKYPLGAANKSIYDPDDAILGRYRPTPVQIQVWEDLCHVAPTLSFTRPAKYMYRSIAQFGAWVLARAQRRAIEIVDDDNISIISTQSDSDYQSDAELGSSSDSMANPKPDASKTMGSVGRAGDPLPPFENNMIRQKIDRYGRIYPLANASDLPALQMSPDEVGVIKPGPVRKWLEARKTWDERYSHASRKVRKERVKALASGEIKGFEEGEHPPPSALAGRRTAKDLLLKKKKKSYGLAMWSMWGSKHDESTLKREEEAEAADANAGRLEGEDSEQPAAPESNQAATDPVIEPTVSAELKPAPTLSPRQSHTRQRSTSSRRGHGESLPRGRNRTTSVTDRGQAEGRGVAPQLPPLTLAAPMAPMYPPEATTNTDLRDERATSPNPSLLSAGFIPRFRTVSHLREDSGGHLQSDAASTMTGRSGMMADDASTRAIFAAPGVAKNVDPDNQSSIKSPSSLIPRPGSPLANDTRSFISDSESVDHRDGDTETGIGASSNVGISRGRGTGNDTPRSQRSLDRLQSHQQDEGMGRLHPIRSPSSTAVVRAEGIATIVDADADEEPAGEIAQGVDMGTNHTAMSQQKEKDNQVDGVMVDIDSPATGTQTGLERPKMYERADTQFQTAAEKLS